EKLLSIYDRGPFQVNYEATLDMSGLGQPLAGTLTGHLTQADRTHSRMQLSFDMPGSPEMPGGGMAFTMLTVTDGTTTWTEMDNPTAGGKQVTRIALAELEKSGQSMAGMSPTSIDPVAQLETLTRTMDFEVVERAGGEVTLRGAITEESRAKLGMLAVPGVDGFIFVLDEQTGFPTQVRAEGEPPFISMTFRDLEFVDAAKLPAGLFEYTPPEGLPVMDLGAMLRSQRPAQEAQ
ncbi:MAG: hypothetical protein GY713_17795, partial [Actinomycetia bacterium]|nr:hypothetical protein [Actinomycetes bacterium]